jgi:aminopeptidase YwaD
MKRWLWFVLVLAVMSAAGIVAQEREDRTLLSHAQMRAIINEASGERALHATLEMVPYPRMRDRAEYTTHFRETAVIEKLAKDAGFSHVTVESFPESGPMSGSSWYASVAQLWQVEPVQEKLYDVNDVLVSVASGSDSGDVTATLVDAGAGLRPEDYAGKDIAGKIVLASGSLGRVQRLAVVERGAVGVVSYNALRADDEPDQLMSQSVSSFGAPAKKVGFGWSVSPRIGRGLAARLAQGEKVVLRSLIKAETFPGEMEMVTASIPGDGTSTQSIVVSAHMYEGYTKQGANDDNSGCTLSLEMGRAYLQLIKEGKLPKPTRTIHFIWVPEIMGSMAWLKAHPDIKSSLIADLNFDMDGILLSLSGSSWVMHRTPDSLPSFLNDLCANVLKYVADLNTERLRFRSSAYGFTLPVVAPTGSHEPFWTLEDTYYGASDHVVFINQGIPGVMFITWPDHFYHSSQDTPERLDPTQFKRAAVVGIGSMALLASANDETALKVAAESLARGAERMGKAQKKGLGYVADLPNGLSLPDAVKEANVAVRHQADVEKAVVRSAATLFADPKAAGLQLAGFDALIDQRASALQNEIRGIAKLRAGQLKLAAFEAAPTDLEKLAARTLVEPTPEAEDAMSMFGGRRRGGPGAPESPVMAAMRKLPSETTGELNTIVRQKKTVLQIRDFISGEFGPVPVADVFDYLKALQTDGQVKLVEQPESPVKGKKAAPKK